MKMKTKYLIGILIILISISPCFVSALEASHAGGNVLLGVAQVNITPSKPTLLSGYAARTTPFTGVHDSLYASAFYFSSEKVKNLVIIIDVIGFPFVVGDEIRGLISSELNIPASNINLVATHTHGGPSVNDRGPESVVAYTAELKKKLVGLALEASRNPVPFRMGAGKGHSAMSINRRAEFSKGEVWLGRNFEGVVDHELSVVKFENMQGDLLAVMINWPCHGTVTGDSNYLISGDWPGASARYIQEHTGKDVIVGVTAGASGDINPIYGPGNVFREVDAIGYHIGSETLRVMESLVTYPVGNLASADTILTFPGKRPLPDRFPVSSYEPGPDVDIRLSVFKIGNLVLAGISGELMTEIGMEIKSRSPYSNTIIMTHCNGSSGYICTDSSFPEGGYEIQVTRLMPGVEEPLIQQYINMFESF
jgi:neutral ceramidase